MKYYKVLQADGTAHYSGAEWYLPKRGPGRWMPEIKEIIECVSGYHLVRKKDLLEWLHAGTAIFEAEGRGGRQVADSKVVFRQARLLRKLNWDDSVARHFACDCAERSLHIFEAEYPDDSRVRNAIETARRVANGDIPISELAAAWAAERKWQTRRLSEYLRGKR
tara:strand:- start:3814 stop:4308 length:495 start_codon:yes stop_codon:yes gene_type:complete